MDAQDQAVESSGVRAASRDRRLPQEDRALDVGLESDSFVPRHIGPSDADVAEMLAALGLRSLDELVDKAVPAAIRLREPLKLGPPRREMEVLAELRELASK